LVGDVGVLGLLGLSALGGAALVPRDPGVFGIIALWLECPKPLVGKPTPFGPESSIIPNGPGFEPPQPVTPGQF
jgi:hypothetical protein